MTKKSVKVVAGVLVSCPDKHSEPLFLLSLRQKGRSLAGYWEFPGGKIEPLETPQEALQRELLEELDVVIDPQACYFLRQDPIVYPEFSVDLSFFQVHKWKGDPFGNEGQTVAWFSYQEAKSLKTLPLITTILKKIREL